MRTSLALHRRRGPVGQPWACCPICGIHYPASYFTFDTKYGWRCHRCKEDRPDLDDFRRGVRHRLGEGSRRTKAPKCDPNEGIEDSDTLLGFGYAPFGTSPYGIGVASGGGYGSGPFGVTPFGS